jgi:hypothetical protein
MLDIFSCYFQMSHSFVLSPTEDWCQDFAGWIPNSFAWFFAGRLGLHLFLGLLFCYAKRETKLQLGQAWYPLTVYNCAFLVFKQLITVSNWKGSSFLQVKHVWYISWCRCLLSHTFRQAFYFQDTAAYVVTKSCIHVKKSDYFVLNERTLTFSNYTSGTKALEIFFNTEVSSCFIIVWKFEICIESCAFF